MSHHFDTKLAKEDPSLNLCDFYLFDGEPGMTVMAMTVNPDVGLSALDTLHPEGLYAFRFDLNDDAREEVTFKFRFSEPRHGSDEHTHIQKLRIRKATGNEALRGDAGELLLEGETGKIVSCRFSGFSSRFSILSTDLSHLYSPATRHLPSIPQRCALWKTRNGSTTGAA